jgi:hypothetical protein
MPPLELLHIRRHFVRNIVLDPSEYRSGRRLRESLNKDPRGCLVCRDSRLRIHLVAVTASALSNKVKARLHPPEDRREPMEGTHQLIQFGNSIRGCPRRSRISNTCLRKGQQKTH